jgi:ribosomal protein S18 acetylase RimI-like enzyme
MESDVASIVNDLRINFHDKYSHIFCGKEKIGSRILRDYYNHLGKGYLDNHIVAEEDGRIIGVIGVLLPHMRMKFPSSTLSFWKAMHLFGLLRGVKVKIAMKIAESDEFDKDSSYVEFLCVLSHYRHHGVGSKLLDEAERFTKSKGFGAISLFVLEKNKVARQLYEEHGYKEVRRINSRIMQFFLGFREMIYMKKPI